MDAVETRLLAFNDLPGVVRLDEDIWFTREYFKDDARAQHAVTSRFVLEHFARATWGRVAVRGAGLAEEIIGVVIASVHGQPLLFPQGAQAAAEAKEAVAALPDGQRFLGEYSDYLEAKHELTREAAAQCDAEFQHFLVAPSMQGCGIGARLWQEATTHFAAQGVASYYLYTDSACDWQIYEAKGFERVAERFGPGHGGDDERYGQFVYVGEARIKGVRHL